MTRAKDLLQRFHSENDQENYSPQVQKLMAEWEQDRVMARERHDTGKEPPNRPLEVRDAPSPSSKRIPLMRERSSGIDIPF